MRILNINKFYFLKGGAERHYFDLTKLLEKHGHTVIPFAMQHPQNLPTPWARFFVSEKNYRSRTSIVQRLRDARDILWNFEAARNLEALIYETKPDLAHLHNIAHQLSPSIIHVLRRHNIPIVQTLHDYKLIDWNYLHYPRSIPWGEQLVLRTERTLHQLLRSYSYINHFITPSKFMKQECVKVRIPENKITVVPYCLPHLTSPWKGEESHHPSPYEGEGKGEVNPYLLFVGRLSPEKGLDILLQAMQKMPDVHLKIVGASDEILRYAQNDNIEFLGHQDQNSIQRLMANALALVVPSVWPENSPLVIYEAYAQGIPVLASRIGGIPELVRDHENGLLFKPNNVADLVSIMRIFLKLPPATQQAMGNAGKSFMHQYANPATIYQHILEVYNRILHATIS